MALGLLKIEWDCLAGELIHETALVKFGKIVACGLKYFTKTIYSQKSILTPLRLKLNGGLYGNRAKQLDTPGSSME